jgi:two-component system copper resistance phosphate regulon response regulator CusR
MNRILIVEDEDRIASFVAKGLKAEGFTPTVVSEGVTGLDYALTGEFDLIVLDIGLPGMDGFAILERVTAERPALPVIVLTARDSVTDTVAALESGAADYMSKPFRFGELLARVRLRLRSPGEAAPDDELVAGSARLDLRRRRAFAGDKEVGAGVRPRRGAAAKPRPRALARAAAVAGVGVRLRPGLQRRGRLHRVPAQEARRRPGVDRPRHGLPRRLTRRRQRGRPPLDRAFATADLIRAWFWGLRASV